MLKALALSFALAAATPGIAAAEWHLTPMVGVTFGGNTNVVDLEGTTGKVHRQFGAAATLFGSGLVGLEGVFVYTPGFFQRGDFGLVKRVKDSRSFAVMGNAVLTTPRRWTEYSLRPFVSGGLGVLHVSVTDTLGAFPVHSTVSGFNVGGGAVGFLSARTGVRFDLRYYSSLHRNEQGTIVFGRSDGPAIHLSYMTGSIGLVLRR